LLQGQAGNDEICSVKKQPQKKQVEETKREQRRREKAEVELKKKRSLEKQASLMERFLKKCKTNSSSENDKVSTKSNASDLSSAKNESLYESATLSMDSTLASSSDVTLEDIRKQVSFKILFYTFLFSDLTKKVFTFQDSLFFMALFRTINSLKQKTELGLTSKA